MVVNQDLFIVILNLFFGYRKHLVMLQKVGLYMIIKEKDITHKTIDLLLIIQE